MNRVLKIDRELSDFDRVLDVSLYQVYKINCLLEYILLKTGIIFFETDYFLKASSINTVKPLTLIEFIHL